MEIEEKDSVIQNDSMNVLGFTTRIARRNLILGFLVLSWIGTVICAYNWARCERLHKETIERLNNKYEAKIDELYKMIMQK